jgi:hypothetical protein
MQPFEDTLDDFRSGNSKRWLSGSLYSDYHCNYAKSLPDPEPSIEALEVITFGFPACSDERMILLWAVNQLKGL